MPGACAQCRVDVGNFILFGSRAEAKPSNAHSVRLQPHSIHCRILHRVDLRTKTLIAPHLLRVQFGLSTVAATAANHNKSGRICSISVRLRLETDIGEIAVELSKFITMHLTM